LSAPLFHANTDSAEQRPITIAYFGGFSYGFILAVHLTQEGFVTSKEKAIYLIDGSSYIYRAYHAVRHLSTSQGLPTNAIFGFTNMLLKLLSEHNPEYMAMAFDAKGPTFRHKMYDAYKANRPPMPEDLVVQIPYIKQVVEGMNIASLELPGYEADDIIGTLVRTAEETTFKVVMVTGDKDFKQLISTSVGGCHGPGG